MLHLTTLGRIDLRDPGGESISRVLSQPKRFALLVYLASLGEGEFCTRETLLALFWPERSEKSSRNALSQSLSFLRQHLPEGSVQTRGPEGVGLPPGAVASDVGDFEAALSAGDWDEAMQLYGGDFLPGFHVSEAWGFEEWKEKERSRLRSAAIAAGWKLAISQLDRGAGSDAKRTARRVLNLASVDQVPLVEFASRLAQVGEGPSALRLIDEYCDMLRRELDLDPTPFVLEARKRIQDLLAAGEARNQTPHQAEPGPDSEVITSESHEVSGTAANPSPPGPSKDQAAKDFTEATSEGLDSGLRHHLWPLAMGAAVVLAAFVWVTGLIIGPPEAPPSGRIVVLPFEVGATDGLSSELGDWVE